MLQALDLEIAAIKKRGGSSTSGLVGGRFIGRAEGNYLYKFPLTEELHLRDETPIRIQFDQHDVEGTVVSVTEKTLIVAVVEDLGPNIPRARLVADDSFLVERLKERLRQVESGEKHFNHTTARRVIGLEPVRVSAATMPPALLAGDTPLNEDQELAVRRSLGTNVSFVWGPPGTGKTTTIAGLAEGHYRQGRSVLLVSNTNIAVDTALEKIAVRLKGEPDFQAGAVLRYGPLVKPELTEEFGEQVVLDRVVARLSEHIERQIAEAQGKLSRVSRKAEALQAMVRDYERLAATREALERERKVLNGLGKKLQAHEWELKVQGKTVQRLRSDIDRASSMGAVRRFFSGLDPDQLRAQLRDAEIKCRALKGAKKAVTADIPVKRDKATTLEHDVAQLQEQTGRHEPESHCRTRLGALNENMTQLRAQIAALEQEKEQIRKEVVNRCRIMASTVYRTYLKGQIEREFDVVIIDEASMLMLPMAYYAAGLAQSSVTVAGDFRQLPPIVLSDDPLAQEWLKKDVFVKAGACPKPGRQVVPEHLIPLHVQYRMQDDICGVVNDLFYPDHPLVSHPSVRVSRPHFPLAERQLTYVDTASLHPWASFRLGSRSRYNLLHAQLVKKLVAYLVDQKYLALESESNDRLGAVAPFAAQTRLVQALLQDAFGPVAKTIAATVHRFQGNEKATMIVDLTDSIGCPLSKFMKGVSVDEDDGARLLNVAISRAKDHLILIANFDFFLQKAPPNSVVRQLLQLFRNRGEALAVDEVLPLGDDDWINGLSKVIDPSLEVAEGQSGMFNEGTFYPAFAHDLQAVSRSLVLFSPYLTARGVGRWVDYFRAAVQRGVSVRIVTRPAAEFGGASNEESAEAIAGLRALGVVVDLRARMHEKIALIDDRVIWGGSLNVLSHRDTSEFMLRLEGSTFSTVMAQFLSTPIRGKTEDRVLTDRENPLCPKCGAATVWKDGRYGIYFECEAGCGGKVDSRWRSSGRARPPRKTGQRRRSGGQTSDAEKRPCPACGGTLRRRTGRFGPFLGCSNYPKCRYTEDLR